MNLAGCPDTDTSSGNIRMKARRTLWLFILDGSYLFNNKL